MGTSGILIVGETPSLGRSISDLLESAHIPHRLVYDVSAAHPLATLAARHPVLVAACNEYFCATVRRWARAEFPGVTLVVVGDRDPGLGAYAGIRVVPLPLVPAPFLELLGSLLDPAPGPRAGTDSDAEPR
ncbi:MAG TPA: hypothetical protein VMC82_05640 [Thermoplasmata archaeon]|nr:hypothetical protein [Thermoplasmata archaeon]